MNEEMDASCKIRNSWSIFADILIQFIQSRRDCMVSNEEGIIRTRNRIDKLFIPTNKMKIRVEETEFIGRDGYVVKGEWLIPRKECNSQKAILYFHGGGFCLCSINTHRKMASQIALASNTRLFIFEYRRTPEFAYPAQVHDGIDAFNFVCQNRQPKDVIFVGDSAGGHLAVSVPLHILKTEQMGDAFLPAGVATMSAWVDLTNTADSHSKFFSNDFLPSRKNMSFHSKIYRRDLDPESWQISPVFGDFSGFPPLYLQASESEQLIDDSILLAKNARKAGVYVRLDTWQNQPHVFQAFGGKEANDAMNKMGKWIMEQHDTERMRSFLKDRDSKFRGNFSDFSRSIDSLKSSISMEAKYSL